MLQRVRFVLRFLRLERQQVLLIPQSSPLVCQNFALDSESLVLRLQLALDLREFFHLPAYRLQLTRLLMRFVLQRQYPLPRVSQLLLH